MKKEQKTLAEIVQKNRELVFPGMTLCVIHFSNGTDTNDFVPNEILADKSQSAADWWNDENKENYIPLMQGKLKAINVTPISRQ